MRTALVTGGGRGIGKAVAEAFRERGLRVVTPAREELDLARRESVERYVKSALDEKIDILVNNAGVNFPRALDAVTDEQWDIMLEVNVKSPLRLLQGVTPGMKSGMWGRVVNVSSVFSLVSRSGRTVYSATKASLNALTRTAAIELAPFGILVNSVAPGYVETEMTHANNTAEDIQKIIANIPAGRLAQTAEIAAVVDFLCSESNTYLTGQTIAVDGGFTCQ